MAEIILIAGASSDIGLALARRLLSRNPLLQLIAHSFAGGERIARLQSDYGERVFPVQADLSDAEAVTAMIGTIAEKFDAPSQIVYLPALALEYERLTKFRIEHLRKDMALQVEAPAALLKRFAPKMSKSEGARFVFVLSSVVTGMPPKYMSMYTVVKYAQLGLMRAAAAEYAGTHLSVNAVAPGMVETQFLEKIGQTAVEMAAAASPRGRNATPEDLLGAIDFLLSPAVGYVTGVVIPITAGSTC